jgi:hypothetical protein
MDILFDIVMYYVTYPTAAPLVRLYILPDYTGLACVTRLTGW